jgi:hypothetical protein
MDVTARPFHRVKTSFFSLPWSARQDRFVGFAWRSM